MLTFESIRKIVNEEKDKQTLGKLPENFFEDARAYLRNKQRLAKGKEDLWEVDSAKRLLQDLLEMREKKLVLAAVFFARSESKSGDNIAGRQAEPENTAADEDRLFRSLADLIGKFQKEREGIFREEAEARKSLVALLGDLPEFVGTDLKAYGPYRAGDIATMPEDVAKMLAGTKAAKIIEVK
ncbi:MAG: DNA replication complex GINS family protein [Candidatus Aenigmarchaeota archaeon]|nr:DNA replication complex GINS family protein [Candidatus Aenigmarchaeota archaeon]